MINSISNEFKIIEYDSDSEFIDFEYDPLNFSLEELSLSQQELLDNVDMSDIWIEHEQVKRDRQQALDTLEETKCQEQSREQALQIKKEIYREQLIEAQKLEAITSRQSQQQISSLLKSMKNCSSTKIKELRKHKYYRLAALADTSFYSGRKYALLVFAFKNSDFANQEALIMLNDLVSIKIEPLTGLALNSLVETLMRTLYPEYTDQKIINGSFAQIQKLIKADDPVGYDLWLKECKADARKARTIVEHPIARFIRQMNHGKFSPTDLHKRYLDTNPKQACSLREFGLFLAKNGLRSIVDPKRVYILSAKSIQAFDT